MKYNKLINNYKNNKFITNDGLLYFYKYKKNKIKKNKDFYINFIKLNPEYYEFYLFLQSQYTNNINNDKKLYKKSYKLIKQEGGDASAAFAVIFGLSGSLLVSTVLIYFVYKFLTRKVCKKTYTITSKDVGIVDIIYQLIPPTILIQLGIKISSNSEELINYITEELHIFLPILNPLFEVSDSILGFIADSGVRIATGIAAIITTSGLGGDTVVNLIYVLKNVISVLIKILNILANLTEAATQQESLNLIYDIFGIDFTDGPFGVKCWINYIWIQYRKDASIFKVVCNIIIKPLIGELAKLIGSAISTMLPDTAGIFGVIITAILDLIGTHSFGFAASKLSEYYYRIPYDQQMILQDPKQLANYLLNAIKFIKKNTPFINNMALEISKKKVKTQPTNENIFDKARDDVNKLFDVLEKNANFFAITINKMFALTFALLYLSSHC